MSVRISVASLVVLLISAGCSGGGDPNAQPTYAVSGQVNFQGAGLGGATVVFIPANSSKGVVARGLTESDGSFELTTYENGDGAAAADYKVTIIKIGEPTANAGGGSHGADAAPGATSHDAKASAASNSVIAEKYARADESGLTATVTAGGDNSFTFDVE